MKIQLTVRGPQRASATSSGYGDYYTISDDIAELDFVLVRAGSPRPTALIRRMVARVRARLRAEAKHA